jgi:hypothetical protein
MTGWLLLLLLLRLLLLLELCNFELMADGNNNRWNNDRNDSIVLVKPFQ